MGPERTTEAVCCLFCEKMDHYNCLTTLEQNLFLFYGCHDCYSCLVRDAAENYPIRDLAYHIRSLQFTELVDLYSVKLYKRMGLNPVALR